MQAPRDLEAPRPNPRLMNMLFVLYAVSAVVTAALIAYGVWEAAQAAPTPGGAKPATAQIARDLARQHTQRQTIVTVGGFLVFAWLGGVLLLRTRASYQGVLDQTRALREEIVDLNRKDTLTGIGNRRLMVEELSRITAQADREGKPLAFAWLGVDLLKQINDAQGIKAGDTCLMSVAASMQACARRPLDLAVRLGGDEFLLCWYDTTPEHALEMAQSLQAKIKAMPLRHADGAPLTLSIGLARRNHGSGASWESALRQAEDAMRHAKAAGRDRIVGS